MVSSRWGLPENLGPIALGRRAMNDGSGNTCLLILQLLGPLLVAPLPLPLVLPTLQQETTYCTTFAAYPATAAATAVTFPTGVAQRSPEVQIQPWAPVEFDIPMLNRNT